MNLLFGEFINDNVMLRGKHLIDNWYIAFWNLTKSLVEAFSSVTPLEHPLFKNNSQLNQKECQKLFKYYNAGLERLKIIYRQEILKTETINSKERKAKEVIVSKVKDIKKAEKETEKVVKLSEKRSLKPTKLPEQLSLTLKEIQTILDLIYKDFINIEHIFELSLKKQKIHHLTTQ